MKKVSVIRMACLLLALGFATAIASSAQTFTNLSGFTTSDGTSPTGPLAQGIDGNFYGTAAQGGANILNCENMETVLCGTVFKFTASGSLSPVYSFCADANCADGQYPSWGLALATNGNFYGTTEEGGANSSRTGEVFEITPEGKLTVLYSFCSLAYCADGEHPEPGLLFSNGNFYGTTVQGGGSKGAGTFFEITPAGKLTTLYDFCSQANCTDGSVPNGGLVQATNGNFYGTTGFGGSSTSSNCAGGCGIVFEITPAGKLTTLHTFCLQASCPDGGGPSPLIQAANGNLYGTTGSYGAHGGGTFFEITPAGKFTTLYSFCSKKNCTDGSVPDAPLVQATDGDFYGTTYSGGADNEGTAFKLTAAGALTTLYSFCSQKNCADGSYPEGLLQGTDGDFYGATVSGGTNNFGTVFSLSEGLGAFVKIVPGSGKVGTKAIILGNDLTGTTSVTFNGKTADFTVVSNTEITTAVPSGATTGTVKVTTPSGTLDSNVAFRVTN